MENNRDATINDFAEQLESDIAALERDGASQAEREREVAERQGEMDKLAAGIVVVEKK